MSIFVTLFHTPRIYYIPNNCLSSGMRIYDRNTVHRFMERELKVPRMQSYLILFYFISIPIIQHPMLPMPILPIFLPILPLLMIPNTLLNMMDKHLYRVHRHHQMLSQFRRAMDHSIMNSYLNDNGIVSRHRQ